jgi:RND family efflux transporter MFP subunit
MKLNRLAVSLWAITAPVFCPAFAWAAGTSAPEFDCLIEPAQVVEIRSPVVGLLQTVHVRRGDTIRQNQILVTIESSVEQSAADAAQFRAQARGSIQFARAKATAAAEKAKRMTTLSKDAFISAQARDDALAELKLAEAELKNAEENSQLAKLEHKQALDQLNRRVIRSPFNGVVVEQHLFPGSLVDTADGKKPILKIAQTNPLTVHAILPYRLFPQIKRGMSARVTPEKPFAQERTVPIQTVDKVIDSAAGTFGVLLYLENDKQSLPSGIRCKLKLAGL